MQAACNGTTGATASITSLMDRDTKKISLGSLQHQFRSPHALPHGSTWAVHLPFLIFYAAACTPKGTS